MGHLQPAPADGLCGHRGDRHALREEVRCAGKVLCPPGARLGFPPVRYLTGPGWEGVTNPVLKRKLESICGPE